MFSSTTQATVNRRQLYRQTYGILNANSLHFNLISLLFIPLTFSASAAVQFYFSSPSITSSNFDVATSFDPIALRLIKTVIASSETLLSLKTLIHVLAFILFVILPTVAGIALITFSAHQASYRKRLTFSSTLKSLSHSFIPLLSTVLAGSIKLIFLSLSFTLSPFAITEAIKALGFHSNPFIILIFLNTITSYALAFTIVFFIVIWGSAPAISVLELKSGFEPLRQSADVNQSTEFRSHSFSIVLVTGYVVGSWLSYSAIFQTSESLKTYISIWQVVAIYLLSSMMILLYAVANTVLYVQGKVAGGEEIAITAVERKVSGEYVSVVVDDEGDDVPLEPVTNGAWSYTMYFFLMVILWSIIRFNYDLFFK